MLEQEKDPYEVGSVWNVVYDNFEWKARILSHNEDGSVELQLGSTKKCCRAQKSHLLVCESDLSEVEQLVLEGVRGSYDRLIYISSICDFPSLRVCTTSAKIYSAIQSLIDKKALISPRRSYVCLPESERAASSLQNTNLSAHWHEEDEPKPKKQEKILPRSPFCKISKNNMIPMSLESHWRTYGSKHQLIIE